MRNKDKSQHVRMFSPVFRTVTANVGNSENCLIFNAKVVSVFHSEVSRLLEKRLHFLRSCFLKISTFKVFSNNSFVSNPAPLRYPSFQSAFKLSICRTFRILFADNDKRISTQLIFPSFSLSR